MIVGMKKCTLLMSAADRTAGLTELRRLGVMHIRYIQPPESEEIEKLQWQAADIEKALRVLDEKAPSQRSVSAVQIKSIVQEILELVHEKSVLMKNLGEQQENGLWFQRWGSVSLASIRALQDAGIFVKFCMADIKAFHRLPPELCVFIVKKQQGMVQFALFSDSDDESFSFKQDPIPSVEYSEFKTEIRRLQIRMAQIDKRLKTLSAYRTNIETAGTGLLKRIEFSHVLHGMGEEESFVYLQGFCPAESTPNVKKLADKEGWAYAVQEPDDPDEVPTLIRTPRWLRIISPVFTFMGTVPGYAEYDISFWFLLFFSIFFALLIGDAGYGLFFLLAGFLLSRKFKKAPREPFLLLYVLSGATILWGALSGNWFGMESIARIPVFNRMVIEQINSFAENNTYFMMYLCFVIGIIHLSIAHALKALKMLNSLKALAEAGWIALLWTLFFMAGNLVLQKPVPAGTPVLFLSGLVLTLVFSNFHKNVLKGIAVTLGDLPLSIISSFSDIVSYLRLFAVGYASVTVAASFNRMALEPGIHSILSGLMAALILFLGHSLNIILGLLAVIVHGIRLNMLEFSGQLSMQWSGKEYRPFKE
jgi:V/A-type H+-transporting ATPase subunit I